MPRAQTLECEAKPTQHFPAPLAMDRMTKALSHPGSNLGAGPHAAIGCWSIQTRDEVSLKVWREQGSSAGIGMAAIAKGSGTASVVASGEGPNPVKRIAGNSSNLCGRGALRQEPEDLVMAALDGIGSVAITCAEVVD